MADAPHPDAGPPAGRRPFLTAAAVAASFLSVALLALPDYGPTWDCANADYAFGEAVLDGVVQGVDVVAQYQSGARSPARAPHPEFERNVGWPHQFPLAPALSAASCRVLWTGLGWLPPFVAHHLVVPLLVSVLLAAMVVFLWPFGAMTGVAAAALLVTAPRFFADAMNNLKDGPEAALYSLCALVFFAVTRQPTVRGWLAVGALGASALAQKQNAWLLPVQFAVTLVAWRLLLPRTLERSAGRGRRLAPLAGVVAAAVAYVAVSPQLWTHFPERAWLHFAVTTSAGHAAFSDAGWAISFDAVQQVLRSTPLPLLALAAIGAFAPGAGRRMRLFLGAWLSVSIGRVLLPGMRDFDGVRHFLEFYPPLAMLAALGLRAAVATTRKLSGGTRRVARLLLIGLALAPGAIATWRTHPNGVCYFNELAGGLAGARRAGMPDAGDYWGNSYWQGLAWLDDHAEPGAMILAPIAPQVLRAGAAVRLRADLAIHAPSEPPRAALYAMYIVRPGWYGRTVRGIERLGVPPVHEVMVQGAPVLRIFRFDPTAAAPVLADWARESRAQLASGRLIGWVMTDRAANLPRLLRIAAELPVVGLDESVARLCAMLPPELPGDAADWLWARDEPR